MTKTLFFGWYLLLLGWSHRARIPSTNAISVEFQNQNDQDRATMSYSLNVRNGKYNTVARPDE